MTAPERIRSKRLVLRRPRISDAEAVFKGYAQDPEVSRYLLWRPHRQLAETVDFLRQCDAEWEENSNWTWALVDQEGLAGMIGLHPKGWQAEAGYVLRRDRWGRGLMTEALRAVVDWALQPSLFWRVYAVCDVDNPASARVMQKAGMSFEGRIRRGVLHPNVGLEPRDALLYSIVR